MDSLELPVGMIRAKNQVVILNGNAQQESENQTPSTISAPYVIDGKPEV
jgi:hypothetical protein